MKDFRDAYGHQIYDYLRGEYDGCGCEILERDDGYVTASPSNEVCMYFSAYKDWSPQLKKAMRYVKGRVLDIGCGAGRHALYLQDKGFDVVGIDESPLAVKVCQLRGFRKARFMSVTQVNRSLGRFDTILMLGNNFGMFGSYHRAKWLLRRFRAITQEQARIIAESDDPHQTADPVHLEYHDYNRQRGRMPGQERLRVRYKKHVSPWFDWLMVSQEEMEQILDGTGWRVKRFIDSKWSGYVAIIEKED
jgi:SAM-dependent methyltransferase